MSRISIITAQKVSIEYDTAPWLERVSAFIIDLAILVTTGLILYFTFLDSSNLTEASEIIFSVLSGFVLSTYTLWMEYFFNGQTIGKKLIKIKVVRLDGEPLTFGDIFGRWVFRIIDIYFSFGLLASFLIATSGKKQRIGDMVSNTAMIRDRISLNLELKEILNLASTDTYKPVYEGIIRLKEEDMILVKEALDRYKKYSNKAHDKALDVLCKKLVKVLELKKIPADREIFFKTVIKDFIVLTR